jgi:hypothetical protein
MFVYMFVMSTEHSFMFPCVLMFLCSLCSLIVLYMRGASGFMFTYLFEVVLCYGFLYFSVVAISV